MKISAKDLRAGIPPFLKGQITNITPMGSYCILLVECETHGHEYSIPVTKDFMAKKFSGKEIEVCQPGEELPKHTKPAASKADSGRSGPRIGSRRKIKGVLKECIRYDFESVDLPGKRRQRDPASGRLGYPVWAVI